MIKKELLEKIEDLIEFLDESLPDADSDHKNEILDIAELLKARTSTYINSYGLN